jgi:hypothetical protein
MDFTPVAIALAAALGGLASWAIQSRFEDARAVEARLSPDRRKIYVDILMPYIEVFKAATDGTGAARAEKIIKSVEYRRTGFELALMANDDVVNAFNRMMQHFFHYEGSQPRNILLLFADLLLELRRGLGNKSTKLSQRDMVAWFIKDVDASLDPEKADSERRLAIGT